MLVLREIGRRSSYYALHRLNVEYKEGREYLNSPENSCVKINFSGRYSLLESMDEFSVKQFMCYIFLRDNVK